MCGIAGIIGEPAEVALEPLRRMTGSIAHRGPDGDGHWLDAAGRVGLGHRRLAIIDLSDDGRQPMHYRGGRYTLVFNGEIYNYVELRERLLGRGYRFKSSSDTEVLLALFDEKKEECLSELDGMFAFAIWDDEEQRLFCARDRFGEKPCFYALRGRTLYFASEMKALWAAGVPRAVNNRLLYNYVNDGFTYDPRRPEETFFEGVHKLRAAHYFFVTPGGARPEQKRYWDIDYADVDEGIGEEAAAAKFRELFFRSVSRRLRSDVPVGSSLSGGLDSSLIVCAIDKLNGGGRLQQSTFSARFRDFAKDEGRYMEAVISRANVRAHFVYPEGEGLERDFDLLFEHQEEPFGSASIYAQFCVMRLAKENGVTVLLDGQGADELLAGYHYYFADYFRGLKATDRALFDNETRLHRRRHGNGNGGGPASPRRRLSEFLPEQVRTKVRAVRRNLREQLSPVFARDFAHEYQKDSFASRATPPWSLQESLYASACRGALEELLRYADRNSMAHSREVRLPFLDHQLAEFLFSLPARFKIRDATTKYIMRSAFADILPPEIAARQDKIGYEPPQERWMRSARMLERIGEAAGGLARRKILHPQFSEGESHPALTWRVLMAGRLYDPAPGRAGRAAVV